MINIQPAEYEDLPEWLRLQMPVFLLDGEWTYYLVRRMVIGEPVTTCLTFSRQQAEETARAMRLEQ